MTRRLLPLATLSAFVLAAAPAVAGSTVKPKSGTYKGTLTAPRTEYAVTLTVSGGEADQGHRVEHTAVLLERRPSDSGQVRGLEDLIREWGVLVDRPLFDQGRPVSRARSARS